MKPCFTTGCKLSFSRTRSPYIQMLLAAYQAWKNDPCTFQLDPTIAAQYGLAYNGAAACEPASVAAAGPPFVPAAAYFTAAGLEQSYGKPSQTTPDFGALVADTGSGMAEVFGISTAAGSVLVSGITGALVGTFYQQIFPFATFAGDWAVATTTTSATVAAQVADGAAGAVATLDAGAVAAGPAAIVFICVVTAGVDAYELYQNQQNLDQVNNLSNLLAQAQKNPPDLNAFAKDTSGLGVTKLDETLVAQTLPDVPSTAALPAHNPGDPVFLITPNGGTPGILNTAGIDDWDGHHWTLAISGGWFDKTCGGGQNCKQTDAFSASVQYLDWSGAKMTASRLGNHFTIIKSAPGSTDKPCPADPTTGVTGATDFSKCSNYVSNQVQYTYAGNQYTMELTNQPAFSDVKPIYFTQNASRQNASVTASGTPAPAISLAKGSSLPAGVYFQGSDVLGNGNGQFQFLGFGSGTAGTYPVTLQAQNGNGTTTQTFQITISPQLQITSPNLLLVPYGQPVSFLVTTTGYPVPALSIDPFILAHFPGLSFHDNGNGTATISGSTTSGVGTNIGGACEILNGKTICTGITATSAQGTVTQPFTVGFPYPPPPQLVLSTATFIAGIQNSFKVTTVGAIAPVAIGFGSNGLSWLSFHDNGDGTGILSGTPPIEASGTYTIYVTPYLKGTVGLGQPFTLNVTNQPLFTSPNTATFTVGDPSSFTISTNQPGGSIAEAGALPKGLEFIDNGNGTATISGTPAAGAGGSIELQLSITNERGTGTQALNLLVNEALSFSTTPIWVNFYAGQNNSFAIPVSGYPLLSSVPFTYLILGRGNYTSGAEFTVSGVPADLSYSNLNPAGYNTGTLTLSGTPSSSDAGQHEVTITATNGVDGKTITQKLILNIEAVPGDVSGDGVVTCTDLYLVKVSFGMYRGQPSYIPQADLNNDGVINIDDLAIVARNLPKDTACH